MLYLSFLLFRRKPVNQVLNIATKRPATALPPTTHPILPTGHKPPEELYTHPGQRNWGPYLHPRMERKAPLSAVCNALSPSPLSYQIPDPEAGGATVPQVCPFLSKIISGPPWCVVGSLRKE